jgi:predicted  nucleic acid-binding Zn-ribbon protein
VKSETEQLQEARATIRRLNRRAQAAESEVAKLRRSQGTSSWDSPERRIEARERDAQMAAIGRAQ